MQLIEDVYLTLGNCGPDRLSVNSGASLADLDQGYAPNAIVPKDDWRPLTDMEQKFLLNREEMPPPSRVVSLLSLSQEQWQPLEEAQFRKLKTPEEVAAFQKRPDIHGLFQPLYAFFSAYLASPDEIVLTPFLTKPANRRTVTTSLANGKERGIGIHLDTWDKLSLEKLPQARNRICINGGTEPRWFLFFNLTVAKMCALLEEKGENNTQELFGKHQLLHRFLELYPGYPMVRLRVDPWEAYMAPTENLFHDATTLGTHEIDVHMTCRGHFQLAS